MCASVLSSPTPTTAETYDKLISSSLSTLSDPSQTKKKKLHFETTARDTLKSSSKPSATPSPLARAWTADSTEFSGIFAQHVVPASEQSSHADNFSEFQSSVPVVSMGPAPPTSNLSPVIHESQFSSFQSNTVSTEPSLSLPVGANQTELPLITTQASVVVSSVAVHNSAFTTLTSVYTQPIAVTSVSGGGVGAFAPSTTLVSHGTSRDLPHGMQDAASASQLPGAASGEQRKPPPVSDSGNFRGLNPSRFPAIYTEVFKRCAVEGQAYVNTQQLYPMLLSSGLPRGVLRDLWSTANRERPGQLNQSELFVLLGLIALAQVG